MNIRWHFTSGGEEIEVEIEDVGGSEPRLVFLNYEIGYDILMESMGDEPSTAFLLNYLWHAEAVATKDFQVCLSDAEFTIAMQGDWYHLGSTDARFILSFKLPPSDRVMIAASGNYYTIEQRVAMLQDSQAIADFLRIYNKKDLSEEARMDLEESLEDEDKFQLACHGVAKSYGYYQSDRRFRLVMETNDQIKARYISVYENRMTAAQERQLIASITSEEYLFEALCHARQLYAEEIMIHARKITNELLRRDLSMEAPGLSFEQRRYLMGKL